MSRSQHLFTVIDGVQHSQCSLIHRSLLNCPWSSETHSFLVISSSWILNGTEYTWYVKKILPLDDLSFFSSNDSHPISFYFCGSTFENNVGACGTFRWTVSCTTIIDLLNLVLLTVTKDICFISLYFTN